MQLSERTTRDMVYVDILKRHGPLSTKELDKEAQKNTAFRFVELVAIEKDTLRFAQHYEALDTLIRKAGKLHWLPARQPDSSEPQSQKSPFLLSEEGFLTSRAGLKCEHCGLTIDLTKVRIQWRLKSRLVQKALHVITSSVSLVHSVAGSGDTTRKET